MKEDKNGRKPLFFLPKRRTHYGILLYFILIAIAVIAGTLGVSVVLSYIVTKWLGWPTMTIPVTAWVMIFIVLVSFAYLMFFQKKLFEPLTVLSRAMRRVATGDFRITLDTTSKVTEIRDIYRSFNRMAKELGATEILQTDFVSNVSHEIKTPIGAIEGYATLLQDGSVTQEEHDRYVEKILYNTHRLSELVGHILLLSKVESKAIQPKVTTYRLDEQVRSAVLSLEPKWTEKGTEFDVDLCEVTYTGNEALLYHVFFNLIGNAVKFTDPGGLVRLRLTETGDTVIFTVEDNGPGLRSGTEKHIFDKFYQADGSHKQEGNGLGLSLVRRILDISDGTVEVTPAVPHGCVFTVRLKKKAVRDI